MVGLKMLTYSKRKKKWIPEIYLGTQKKKTRSNIWFCYLLYTTLACQSKHDRLFGWLSGQDTFAPVWRFTSQWMSASGTTNTRGKAEVGCWRALPMWKDSSLYSSLHFHFNFKLETAVHSKKTVHVVQWSKGSNNEWWLIVQNVDCALVLQLLPAKCRIFTDWPDG